MSSGENNMKDMLRKMAHDIRNPLAVLNGYLMYRKQSEMSAEEKEYLQASLTCVERIESLADEMSLLGMESKDQPLKEAPKLQNKLQTHHTDSNKNVLVIDDDHEIQTQWKILLNQKGFTYLGVDRGEELLEMDINYNNISTAIVDYEFENSSLTGFDIIEFLMRKKVGSIHLCTGLYQNESICEQARNYGVHSIIGKPLPEDVLKLI